MDVLRRLLRPKWIGALLLATLFALACFQLGHWQWNRYEAKVERNAILDRNYDATPVPFDRVLDDAGVAPGADWSRVTLTGDYESDQIYVRNRPNDGVYGYEVLGVLHTAEHGVVIVDRGWVQNSPEGAAVLPTVQPPPTGAVTVTGWVRPYESSLGRDLPAAQVSSIAEPDLTAEVAAPLPPAFVRVQSEATDAGPVESDLLPLEPPDRRLGPHQAYAIQWWVTMALGYAFVILGVRRELRIEEDARDPAAAERRARARAEKKARKVSRWDEEDG